MSIPSRLAPILALILLAGCGQSMDDQPRYDTYENAEAFDDGSAARLPPEGSVPQSAAAYADAQANPPAVTEGLLQHGHERYDIFCSPCHGLAGRGDGMIVQRGFPKPPSFHSARLRAAPPEHFFDVMTKGYGVMYSYASRVPPADRWAIVAYVRALQLSQDATPEQARQAGVKLP